MYKGWIYHLFSKEFLNWKLKFLSLPCKASFSSSSTSSPPFPPSPPPLCTTAIKMRRFKDSRLPPSECEFYKELFYSLDFLVCDFIGLPCRLLLPGEIKSSDFWLAKSSSPSAVLRLGIEVSRVGLQWLCSLSTVLLYHGEMPTGSQAWVVWTISRLLFSCWSCWLQSKHVT